MADISPQSNWACDICTFLNPHTVVQCEMCKTQRSTFPNKSQKSSNSQHSHNDQWNCSSCSYLNHNIMSICEICRSPKHPSTPKDTQEYKDQNNSIEDLLDAGFSFEDAQKALQMSIINVEHDDHVFNDIIHQQTWSCTVCTFLNDSSDGCCQMCGTSKIIETSSNDQKDQGNNQSQTHHDTKLDEQTDDINQDDEKNESKLPSDQGWHCPSCTFWNDDSDANCKICDAPKFIELKSNEDENHWDCKNCTFQNHMKLSLCEMCFSKKGDDEPQKEEALIDLILKMQNVNINMTQKEEKHDILICPRLIAQRLRRPTLLTDIENGLSLLLCVGVIDILNDILESNGYHNKRKQYVENWAQYIDNLTVDSFLSYLDLIALTIVTGYNMIIYCKWHKTSNKQMDLFQILKICDNNICHSNANCILCHEQDPSLAQNITDVVHWNNDSKLKILKNLCDVCVSSGRMKPTYNVKPGKDLNKDTLLQELEKINKNNKFLDIKKLDHDISKYEECKQNASKCIIYENSKIKNYSKTQISEWSKFYKSLPKYKKINYYHELIAVLSRAVRLWTNKYYPRNTQIIPIFLAIEYELHHYHPSTNKGILYEIGTGEGKSIVVILMAAMQCLLFDSLSDVATSQKLLAEREAQETTQFFAMLNIGNGAKYINQEETETKENRKECYKSPVIYSTAYNYECDLLHGANGKEIDCRDGRPFHVNIVDEVDNSFIDLALNSTRLSSPTPGYKEINTILLIISSRMKFSVGSLGDVYVIENMAYFLPIQNKMHVISKYEVLIKHSSKTNKNICVIVTERILNYYVDDQQNAMQLLHEYGLFFPGLSYEKLVKAVNYMKYKEPKLFLQLISHKCILDINTLIMSQRVSHKTSKIEVDFHCCFENGEIVNRTVSCNEFKGYIALSTDSNGSINWNNLVCLEKLDEKSFAKQIKENVRMNVIEYINHSTTVLPSFVRDIIFNRLDIWIDSCWRALFYHHIGKDYVIEKNRICPVDYNNTGCVQHNMHWSNGLHEFLQIKHNLKLSTIGTAANMMTNSCYFGMFEKTYGLTGTLGGDQEISYYKNCFNVDIVRIPSFRLKSNIKYRNVACNNYKEWINLILLSTYSNLRKGRAVLIIAKFKVNADNIETELKHNNYLNNRIMKHCYKYTRDDIDTEKTSVSTKLYGGDVVVATNLAGRGTDIKLSDNVNFNGGLHVIITFIPPNIRIEKQALGRTARAGNPGSGVIIMNKQNCDYARQIDNDNAIEAVRDFYSKHRMCDLQERVQAQKRIESFYQTFTKKIAELSNHHELNDEDKNQIYYLWALTYNTMETDMNNDQLQCIYYKFINKIENDLNSQSESHKSLQIVYNPHYLTWNGIKHSSSYGGSLLNKSISTLGIEYNGIAYYFKARNIIIQNCKAQNEAIEYLCKANESFQYYLQRSQQMNMMFTTRECIKNKSSNERININQSGSIGGQIEFEIKYWSTLIEITQQNIKELQDTGKKAKVSCESLMDTLSEINDYREYERGVIHYYISCGMCNILKFEAKRSWWDRICGFVIAAIGVLEIIAGAFISAIPGLQSVGKSFISNGIDAVIEGVMAMITGQCDDFGDWLQRHALKVGISALCAGVGQLAEKLMSTLSKFIPQKLIDIGKKIFNGTKKLYDKGIFKKIETGNFDLFDMDCILDVSAGFVDHHGIRKGITAARNTINFADAIENGQDPINSMMNFGQNAVNIFGDDEAKNVANKTFNNVQRGVNIARNIADGNVDKAIDGVVGLSSDAIDNKDVQKGIRMAHQGYNVGRNLANNNIDEAIDDSFEFGSNLSDNKTFQKGMKIAHKGYRVGRQIPNGNAFDGADAILGIGDDIFDDEKSEHIRNSIKYSRKGLKTVQRFSESKNEHDIFDGIVNESGDWLNEFGDNKSKQFHRKYVNNGWNGIKNIQNGDYISGFNDFDNLANNTISDSFKNIANNRHLRSFMNNASSLMDTKQIFEKCDELLSTACSDINREITMYFERNPNIRKEFEIMGMLLNGDQYINDCDEKIKQFVKQHKITNDSEMIQWIVNHKMEEIYESNRTLSRAIKSLQSMFGNKQNLNSIRSSILSNKFKQNVNKQMQEIIKLYKKEMEQHSSYSKQIAKWKSDGVDVSINALHKQLCNQHNFSIPSNFINGIKGNVLNIVSNHIVSNIESKITASLQPNAQTMQSVDSENILNQIMNQNERYHHGTAAIDLLQQNYRNTMNQS